MKDVPAGAAVVSFDGAALRVGEGSGRSFMLDARCLTGEPIRGACAYVSTLADPDAFLRFDEPEVQQVRRDAYAWWIPLLGDTLVCLTTLALDGSHYGGAITVTRAPIAFPAADPFARLFPTTLVRSDVFCEVPPPAGPVVERYAGVPWPGGRF